MMVFILLKDIQIEIKGILPNL